MGKITLYGIKNCDTMKKAFRWFEAQGVDYDFYDYKKLGTDEDVLRLAMKEHGWEQVINRKGMTWRKLPDDIKNSMDEAGAIQIALEKPSIIKRPLIVSGGKTYLGFDEEIYQTLFPIAA